MKDSTYCVKVSTSLYLSGTLEVDSDTNDIQTTLSRTGRLDSWSDYTSILLF